MADFNTIPLSELNNGQYSETNLDTGDKITHNIDILWEKMLADFSPKTEEIKPQIKPNAANADKGNKSPDTPPVKSNQGLIIGIVVASILVVVGFFVIKKFI